MRNAIEDFAAAVGEHTAILARADGMRHIDVLADRFGASRVLGGVCIVATVIDEQRRIVQLNDVQSMTYGELDGSSSARLETIDHDCQGAVFAANASSSIVQEMWEKWVFIAALGGITCLLRAPSVTSKRPQEAAILPRRRRSAQFRSRSIQDTVLVRIRWRVHGYVNRGGICSHFFH